MGVGRVLELSRRAMSGQDEAGVALEDGKVLEEREPKVAMLRKWASSLWAGLLLVLTILMRAARLYMGCYVHDRCDGSYQKSLS